MTASAATPAPPPAPAIVQPAPREVSFGLVAGTVAPGTRRIVVRVDGHVVADRRLRGTRFSLHVDLPPRDVAGGVTAVEAGRSSSSLVRPVFGLPRASEPRRRLGHADGALQRRVTTLGRSYSGTAGVYVQNLTTGAGAAWNAQARFPAASTLKLAIALAVLRASPTTPEPGSWLDARLRAMLVSSDNDAANELEHWLGGSYRVDETIRELGLTNTIMYGGYESERRPQGAVPIPIRTEEQPSFPIGKYTTAWDLARLLREVWLAAGTRSSFPGVVTAPDARYVLFLLAHVSDRGKLDRYLAGRAVVLHKAGWISSARHDNGLVFWRGGVFVAAVLTWRGGGADELAGRVARTAYDRFLG